MPTPVIANLMMLENPMVLLIVAGVVVLLFGGAKLAGFGKSLGEGIKEFKKATKDDETAAADAPKSADKPADKEA